MAEIANPLFVLREQLLESLRLTESTEATSQQLTDAIKEVRIHIISKLSSTLVATIIAYTSTNTPTTTEEVIRAKAELLEVSWIKLLLLDTLPSFTLSGIDSARQVFNEESLTRKTKEEKEIEKASLQNKISSILNDLLSGDTESISGVTLIGPEETNTFPGDYIFCP